MRFGGKIDRVGQSLPPRLGGGFELPERRDGGRALGLAGGRLGADALGLEGGRLGADALGFGAGRLDGAGRTLGGVRLDGAGRALGAGRLDVVGRAFGAAVRAVGEGRLVVGGRTTGVGRRVPAGFALGVGLRVVVGRARVVVSGRVLSLGGVARVDFVSSRGRARRVPSETVRVPFLSGVTPVRLPLGTARETGFPGPLSVTYTFRGFSL